VLPHAAYSPDLTPSDFQLFPEWIDDLRGQTSVLMKSRLQYTSGSRREKKKDFLNDGIKKLVKHWQKHIEVGRDYVEKQLCTVVNKGKRYIY